MTACCPPCRCSALRWAPTMEAWLWTSWCACCGAWPLLAALPRALLMLQMVAAVGGVRLSRGGRSVGADVGFWLGLPAAERSAACMLPQARARISAVCAGTPRASCGGQAMRHACVAAHHGTARQPAAPHRCTPHAQVLGDASCTNIGRSVATDWLLKVRACGSRGRGRRQRLACCVTVALQRMPPPPVVGMVLVEAPLPPRHCRRHRRRRPMCLLTLRALLGLPLLCRAQTAYWATWHTSWTQADDRTILVNDTGRCAGCAPAPFPRCCATHRLRSVWRRRPQRTRRCALQALEAN